MTRTRQKILEAEVEPEVEFQPGRTRNRNWGEWEVWRRGMDWSRRFIWWIRSGRGAIFTATKASYNEGEKSTSFVVLGCVHPRIVKHIFAPAVHLCPSRSKMQFLVLTHDSTCHELQIRLFKESSYRTISFPLACFWQMHAQSMPSWWFVNSSLLLLS